jgi:hypothetical protein
MDMDVGALQVAQDATASRRCPWILRRDRTDSIQVSERFEPQVQSAGAARRFVRSCLADWGQLMAVDSGGSTHQ